MIPRLREDGMLPVGIHQATLNELFIAFPGRNQQRQLLNDSLRRVIAALRTLDTTIMIFIDGSYVTSKAEPNDIDLLLITSHHTEPAVRRHLDQVCPVEAVSCAVYVEAALPNRIFILYTKTRAGTAKGIIQIL